MLKAIIDVGSGFAGIPHSRLVREGHVLDAIHTAAREGGRPLRNDGWAAVGRRSSAEQAKLYRRATEILGLADAPRGGV